MGLLLAPYSNAMRLGQGFNSYTQEICIDDAVLIDPGRDENVITNDGMTMSGVAALMGRPSQWIREKEIQRDIAAIAQKEAAKGEKSRKKSVSEAKSEESEDEAQEKNGKENKVEETKGEEKKPEQKKIEKEEKVEKEKVEGKKEKVEAKKEKVEEKKVEEKQTKGNEEKTSTDASKEDGKESKVKDDEEKHEKSDEKTESVDKSTKAEKTSESNDKESKVEDEEKKKENEIKTEAQIAAENKKKMDAEEKRLKSEGKSDEELKAARKRAEARATAAASLRAYTFDQMKALRREKFGDDVSSSKPLGTLNGSYTYKETGRRGPSQIVTYSSRFVDKLSDITDDMNISGSLSIKYGTIGGSGRGAFLDSDKFRESDLNFYISVKVVNQSINYKDALVYNPVASVGDDQKEFNKVFGDSFISGFLEGGEFNAVVSMKVLNKSKMTNIQAEAKVALTVGAAELSANANVDIAKKNISNNTETTIMVSWMGGGFIKPMDQEWNIESLTSAAARFPDLVAVSPQRIYAILTKYETLRSFVALKPGAFSPLQYEVAQIYTNSLLDVYMEYKSMYKDITVNINLISSGTSQFAEKTSADGTVVIVPKTGQAKTESFPKSLIGLDMARKAIRLEMVKIVNEIDLITKDPVKATKPDRVEPFQTPIMFQDRLPNVEPVKKDPAVPLSGEAIEPVKTDKSKSDLFAALPDYTLESSEQASLAEVVKIQPLLAENTRATALYGSRTEGTLFNHLDVIRPTYHLAEVSVEISQGTVVALSCKYSNGLVLTQGRSRNPAKAIALTGLGAKEKILACVIETGRPTSPPTADLCVTALLLYTNRGRSLLGYAADYLPPRSDKTGVRGTRQFKDLSLVEFDPPLEGASLRGFWGRSKQGLNFADSDKIWRIGGIWSNAPTIIGEAKPAVQTSEEVELVGGPKTRQDLLVEANTVSITGNLNIINIDQSISLIKTTEVPQIISGLSAIGQLKGAGLRIQSDVLNSSPSSMTIRSSGWGFKLFRCDTDWMKLPNRPSLRFQTGKVTSNDAGPRNWEQKEILNGAYVPESIKVKLVFPREYTTPPKIIVWLKLVDIVEQENVNHRVSTAVEGLTCKGCTITISTWDKTKLVNAVVGWLAWDSEAPGIVSGDISGVVGQQTEQMVHFEPGLFEHSPEVFIAFRHLDIRPLTSAAVSAEVIDRRATHMKVRVSPYDIGRIDGLDGTLCVADGLVATYLAIE